MTQFLDIFFFREKLLNQSVGLSENEEDGEKGSEITARKAPASLVVPVGLDEPVLV